LEPCSWTPCLQICSWDVCLRTLPWSPCLETFSWKPVLGNLFLGTCSWESVPWTLFLAALLGNLFLETLGTCSWEPLRTLLGNLGTLGIRIVAAPTSSEIFTMAEDPKLKPLEKICVCISLHIFIYVCNVR
jgi:hypothetical protein